MKDKLLEKIMRRVLTGLVIVLLAATVGCDKAADETGAGGQAEMGQQRLVAAMADGVTVELVGVCGYSPEDCWHADGSEHGEKMSVKGRLATENKGDYGFIVKVEGPDDIDFRFYEIKGATRLDDSAEAVDSEGNKLDGFRAVSAYIEDGRTYTSLRVGVAAGRWDTLAEYDGKGENLQTYGDIEFSNLRQLNDRVSISISDKTYGKAACNFLAIDGDGKTHTGRIDDSIPIMRPHFMKVDFYDVKAAEINKICFQKRPFQEVEFRDISLRPGVRRLVEIEVEPVGDERAAGKTGTGCELEEIDGFKIPVESTIRLIDERFIKTQKLEVGWPAGGRLVLNNPGGSIKVDSWDKKECKVIANIEVGLKGAEEAKELLEKAAVQVRLSYRKITVEVIEPEGGGRAGGAKFDFEIMVPREADLELSTKQGSITIGGVSGEVECKTNDGVILAEKINGNVRLRNNYGKIIIRDANFDNGVIRGNTADVDCEGISGDINVRVAAGQVKVVYAKTAPKICNATLSTTDGDIDFTGPVDFSAVVEARTMRGSIETDLPLTVEGERRKTVAGTVGSGEGRLDIKCTIGSIRIRENIP